MHLLRYDNFFYAFCYTYLGMVQHSQVRLPNDDNEVV